MADSWPPPAPPATRTWTGHAVSCIAEDCECQTKVASHLSKVRVTLRVVAGDRRFRGPVSTLLVSDLAIERGLVYLCAEEFELPRGTRPPTGTQPRGDGITAERILGLDLGLERYRPVCAACPLVGGYLSAVRILPRTGTP